MGGSQNVRMASAHPAQARGGYREMREDSRWAVNVLGRSDYCELKYIVSDDLLRSRGTSAARAVRSRPLTRSFPNINKVALTKLFGSRNQVYICNNLRE